MNFRKQLSSKSKFTETLKSQAEVVKDSLPIPAIKALGVARGIYWRTLNPLTFGAAVALTDAEMQKIALIRQTYGDTSVWQLPGGGLDSIDGKEAKKRVQNGVMNLGSELFEPSAHREAKEEIGLDDEVAMTHLFIYESTEKGNRDTLGIFHAAVDDIYNVVLTPQRSEIAEIRLWDLDSLPTRGASYLGRVALELQSQKPVL